MIDRTKVRAKFARALTACTAFAFLASPELALASETLTYSYDSLGRLVKVARAGTVNSGATACYAYDKADNRSNVTSATSSDCASGPVTFSISSNGAVTEGGTSSFTITRSGSPSTAVSVSYSTANGTAAAPGDYTAISLATVTFQPADGSKTVNVTTIDDSVVESAETYTVNLSNPSSGTSIGTGTATATINDNDSNATCSGISFGISDASVNEGGTLVFTVTKSGSTSVSCSVNYATADGTATAGTLQDYLATSGTLTFTSTQTSLTVSVTTRTDTRVEPDETMYLNLSSPTGGAIVSDGQGVGTIFDQNGGGSGSNCPQSCS